MDYAHFRQLTRTSFEEDLVKLDIQLQTLLPPSPLRKWTQKHTSRKFWVSELFLLSPPDLIVMPVWLHGRVLPGAKVDVTLARGCALQVVRSWAA